MSSGIPYFIGSSVRAMDTQGRIVLPPEWLGLAQQEPLFASRWFDEVTAIWPQSEYLRLINDLMKCNELDAEVSRVRRYFGAHAAPVEIDAQGRLVLGKPIRLSLLQALDHEATGGQHRVRLVGCFNHFEVCLASEWTKVEDRSSKAVSQFSLERALNPAATKEERARLAVVS